MYEKLLFPAKINNRVVNNKIVITPPPSFLCESDGSLSPEFFNYYKSLVKSEAGSIIIESSAISNSAKGWVRQPVISDNLNFLAISELVIKIKTHDILPIIQLYHGGINAIPFNNHQVNSPSVISNRKILGNIHSLTSGEIDRIVQDYKNAANLSWNVGFSGIEINAADSTILHQFLSPITNKRNDKFSFIYNNGAFIIRNIINSIRSILPDIIIILKLSLRDLIPGGAGLKNAIEVANDLKNLGVDAFHLTEGLMLGNAGCLNSYLCGKILQAPFSEDSFIFKKETNTCVILSTGISSPDIAEKLLSKDYCDFVSLSRTINREPKWVTMAMTNQPIEFYKQCKHCMLCLAASKGCVLEKNNQINFNNIISSRSFKE